MSDPFEALARAIKQMSKDVAQVSAKPGWKSTVIVHPQIGKTIEEAEELENDWKKREEKQLLDNIAKRLR